MGRSEFQHNRSNYTVVPRAHVRPVVICGERRGWRLSGANNMGGNMFVLGRGELQTVERRNY